MRGDVGDNNNSENSVSISIHASTREATRSIYWRCRSNSISIHASTREATQTHHQHYMCCFYFNSRLYTRGNTATRKAYFGVKDFNSRLYMRGSVILKISTLVILYFNSRLYMRGSKNCANDYIDDEISIHAST